MAVELLTPSGIFPASAGVGSPRELHERFPGYKPTPLREAPRLAEELGVAGVFVKDEGEIGRWGLPAYKILGSSWAMYQVLRERIDGRSLPRGPLTWQALRDWGSQADTTFVTATAGNHGRAVAWMASRYGLASHVFIPSTTDPQVIRAIRDEGATVKVDVISGSFGDAVQMAEASIGPGRMLIPDTGPLGDSVSALVAAGYGTKFHEITDQARQLGIKFDGIAVQAGVGGLASQAALWALTVGHNPWVTVAEPEAAPAVLEALKRGEPWPVPAAPTSMGVLNCQTVSGPALPYLMAGVNAAGTITDDEAQHVVDLLALDRIFTTRAGAAGLAGLLVGVSKHEGLAPHLGIGPGSMVLGITTERSPDHPAGPLERLAA